MTWMTRQILIVILCLNITAAADAQQRKDRDQAADEKPAVAKSFPRDTLSAALKTVRQTAARKKLSRVLVVVRDDSRNKTEGDRTELLAAYRQRMVEQLRSLKLDANESAEVEKLAGLTRPVGAVRTTDLRVFQNFAEFDAILDVVVSERGPAKRLGMTLITEKAKLWSRTVAAPSVPMDNDTKQAAGDGGKANAKPQAAIPVLNQRVLKFALSQLGRKVGNGECWTLAAQALVQSGARPANLFNFGRQIPLGQVVPGDILQFKSARFDIGNSYYLFGAPDHTVIVLGVEGSKVTILHQNFGEKIVTPLTIDFKQMTKGQAWAWRPVGQ